MEKKRFIGIVTIVGLMMLFAFAVKTTKGPVVLGSEAMYLNKSIDDKTKEAELIVMGEVQTNLPSRWKAPNGKDSKRASPEEVSQAHGLFTDSIVSINQILKGDITEPVIRVRSFIGEIETVRWINESQPSFVKKHTYLLFLEKDAGATRNVDPGDYVSVNAGMAVYEIVDGKAISKDDEWVLEELIAYIQNSVP